MACSAGDDRTGAEVEVGPELKGNGPMRLDVNPNPSAAGVGVVYNQPLWRPFLNSILKGVLSSVIKASGEAVDAFRVRLNLSARHPMDGRQAVHKRG